MAVKEPGKHSQGGGRFQPRIRCQGLVPPETLGSFFFSLHWKLYGYFQWLFGVFAVVALTQWLLVLTDESPTSSLDFNPFKSKTRL